MSATIEELPLLRAKARGITSYSEYNPNVGPGSFDVSYRSIYEHPRAPFNSTSERFPASHCKVSAYDNKCLQESPFYDNYDLTNSAAVDNNGRNSSNDNCMVRRGITSCPFRSIATRFADVSNANPGPGSYELNDNWVGKPKPKVYTFEQTARNNGNKSPHLRNSRWEHHDGTEQSNIDSKPGKRKHIKPGSRAAHFAKYSGRKSPIVNSNPGPGTYEVNAPEKSLYTAKPSFMFATKTPRSTMFIKDTPGPGAYNIDNNKESQKIMSETFSAFNSSSPRFALLGKEDFPGPGEYTGNIAPRRPWEMYCGLPITSFGSTAKRFAETSTALPGPGLYDGRIASKRCDFNTNRSFNSTLPRMPTYGYIREPNMDEYNNEETVKLSSIRLPRRVHNKHTPIDKKPVSAIQKENSRTNGLSYDIRYDWPKPKSKLNTTFGTENRFPYRDATNSQSINFPYEENSAVNNNRVNSVDSRRYGNSNWSRSARFNSAYLNAGSYSVEYGGPGEYYNASTFLKKTYNCTIGEDTP